MKKIFLILSVMITAVAGAVLAQQVTQTSTTTSTAPPPPITLSLPSSMDPFQFSVEGGGLWEQKDDRLHDGSEVIGRLTYDLTPNVAIGAESGGIRFVDESDGTKFGRLYGVPAMADLELKMPIPATGNRLVPYVYGSAGAIFWDYSKSDFSDDTDLEAHHRTHFAARPGGGLEYYLTPHIALFIEGSYLFSEKFHLKNSSGTPSPNGKLNVDSIFGGGGIKIAF